MKYVICCITAIVDQLIDNLLWMNNQMQPLFGIQRHGLGALIIRIIINVIVWELSVYIFIVYTINLVRRAHNVFARFQWILPDDL